MTNLKIKPLTKEQIIISIDRLTRFKKTETKYLRVFFDILFHNLISPSFNKKETEEIDYSELSSIVSEIINYSLVQSGLDAETDYSINKKILEYEKSLFKFNPEVEKLLDNKINYNSFLKLIDETCVKNLQWLKSLADGDSPVLIRQQKSLKYPIEMIVIAEGATENILLPIFAKICDFDFDKEGIYLLPAGGKNQVVKLYYELVEILKIPIFILLDKDGFENFKELQPKMRNCDQTHILTCGEFEDLLPFELIKRSLSYDFENISILEDLEDTTPRVKFLEEIFRKRGMHEFKKVDFAQSISKNIKGIEDITPEIRIIIEEIKKIKNNKQSVDN